MDFPNIDPVAFYLGPFPIRWYALAYIAGFLAGWKYCLYLAGLDNDKRPNKTDIDDFLPWAILGVIAGGRFGYVIFYQWEFYASDPLEIARIWNGGMAFHGGILGVIVSLIAYSIKRQIPLLRLSDILACATPIGLFFGRIANFINGELFGRVTNVPWGMNFPRGGGMDRHPSQLYEAALEGLLLFGILFLLVRMQHIRDHAGILSGVFLAGYGGARFFVEFYREPDLQIGYIAGVLTMGQILCIPMILGGMVLIAYGAFSKKDDDQKAGS
ncbi:MAG: prolipoprotein diacylglyceryl transferase [Alphaproteobacteria bacterium]